MNEDIFNKIINSQMSMKEKIKRNPIVINTDTLKIVTFISVMIKIIYIKLINKFSK